MTTIPVDDSTTRLFLRHTLATLAYRAGKTVRGTPAAFGEFRASDGSPQVKAILAHMGDLLDWLLSQLKGKPAWNNSTPLAWEGEIARFFASLRAVDDHLASGTPIAYEPARMFQGAIADALTHTGQLAMLRGIAGQPVRPESYGRAKIEVGRIGRDQPVERTEFDGDASPQK